MNFKDWYSEWQRVTTVNNEWQQLTRSETKSETEWEQVKKMVLAFKTKQKDNLTPEDFYLFWYIRVSKRKYV